MRRTPMPRRSRRIVAGRNRTEWCWRLDDLFRAIVMTKHGAVRMPQASGRGWFWYGRCLRCDCERPLYVSHIEPKGSNPHLRWTEGNAFAFCYACHIPWWHKHPREAEEFTVAVLGRESREGLALRARAGKATRGTVDLPLIEVALKQELRRIAPRGIEGLVY